MVKMALYSSKRLSELLRGITSTNNGDFYCLNCFHAFRTKKLINMYYLVIHC